MSKNYYSLGLMSGTSGDGVDASLINSDGDSNYKVEINKYFEYRVFSNILICKIMLSSKIFICPKKIMHYCNISLI